MSIDTFFLMRRHGPPSDLRELDRVCLIDPVIADDGDAIEAGSQGTVVGIWRDGGAYEVEFASPEGALATVEAEGLRLIERPSL